jgi:hypothetical protein
MYYYFMPDRDHNRSYSLISREVTTIMSCNFEELVGPTLLIGEGKEVYTKELLKDKKYVM